MWDISIDSMNIKKIIKEYIRNSMPINLISYMEKKFWNTQYAKTDTRNKQSEKTYIL